jgi:hypothetical protein
MQRITVAGWRIGAGVVAACLALVVGCWVAIRYAPGFPFLVRRDSVDWIVPSKEFFSHGDDLELGVWREPLPAVFSKEFSVRDVPASVTVSHRAFGTAQILINGALLPTPVAQNWKRVSTVHVEQFVRRGINRIEVKIDNDRGPPALWMAFGGLEMALCTNTSWSVMGPDGIARPARVADDTSPHSISSRERSAWAVLEGNWIAGSAFLVGALFALLHRRFAGSNAFARCVFAPPPRGVAAALSVAWAILFINNSAKMSLALGFDNKGHMEYLQYLLQRRSLPAPTDGWQTYQPPLFYGVAAVLARVGLALDNETLFKGLVKLPGFLAGLAQIWIAYGAARSLAPEDRALQRLACLVAGLVPVNIYMSSYVSNESFAAAWIAAALLATMKALTDEKPNWRNALYIGTCSGAALLSKATALVCVPVILAVLVWNFVGQKRTTRGTALAHAGLAVAVALGISGWLYARNWLLVGDPVAGNWGTFRWWQHPGFHTAAYYASFGRVFSGPYYSGVGSFWDSMYSTFWGDGYYGGKILFEARPPWNYEQMTSLYLLAVPWVLPCVVGLAIGVKKAVGCRDASWALLLGYAAALLLTLVAMTLRLPFYGQAKSSYVLSVILPFSIVCAAGIGSLKTWLSGRRFASVVRPIAWGWFASYAVVAYASFWVG